MGSAAKRRKAKPAEARTPRLAIFRRHSLLDGQGSHYTVRPGQGHAHPFLGPPPFNIGDRFLGLALAKALRLEEFYTIGRDAEAWAFERVNESCAALIFVAQNLLRPGFFEDYWRSGILDKIKIPIIPVSLGVQFDLDEEPHLTSQDVYCLQAIHERCVSSQVRGLVSAELLSRHGIKNVRPLGCPSLLWPLSPKLEISEPGFERVGWSLTEMTDRPALQRAQFKAIRRLARLAERLVPIAQGGEVVLQEFVAARDGQAFGLRKDSELRRDGKERALAPADDPGPGSLVVSRIDRRELASLEADVRWVYRELGEKLIRRFLEGAFFSPLVAEYLRHHRQLSLMAGTRLHGNLMALVQGVPTLFAYHDLRVKEVAELLDAPRFDLRFNKPTFSLERYDWQGPAKKLPALYQGFRAFFEENGLSHRLGP